VTTGTRHDDSELDRYGYRQQFARSLRHFESFAVAFSFISITTGIFMTYGFALATGGPCSIWTWLIVVAGQSLVALVYGALATRVPLSGYSYQWASRLAFTGDWIPDHELARRSGARTDPGTRGPAVDTALETSVPLVFAAGNLVHAAETADVAALGGRHAARHIAAAPAAAVRVPLVAEAPLSWISPNALRIPLTLPPRGRFLLRTSTFRSPGRFEVRQGDHVLASVRHGRLVPGRAIHLRAGWTARANPADGPVRVALA
jgi:hypothetical protein